MLPPSSLIWGRDDDDHDDGDDDDGDGGDHDDDDEAETIEEHCSAICASGGLTMVKQIY